jgi:hypothetical protein
MPAMPPPVVDSAIYDKQLAWKLHGQRKVGACSKGVAWRY